VPATRLETNHTNQKLKFTGHVFVQVIRPCITAVHIFIKVTSSYVYNIMSSQLLSNELLTVKLTLYKY